MKKVATGAGLNLALQGLGAADVVAGLAALAACRAGGWPYLTPELPEDSLMVGIAGIILGLQFVLRAATLGVMARWTWRLIANRHVQERFPVSTRWAWLGWFVPFVSWFFPVRAVLLLNAGAHQRRLRKGLILAWWGARYLTCPTGVFIYLFGFALILVIGGLGRMDYNETSNILGWLTVIGLTAKLLEVAVVTLTWRHQSQPGDMRAATVF